MDRLAQKIIAALRENGRATYAELGRTIGLDVTALVGVQPTDTASDEAVADALGGFDEGRPNSGLGDV